MLMDRPSDQGTPVACIQPQAADPAHTPTTMRVSDPVLCLCQRSARLTGAPRTTGTPKNHLSMAIHFYSHACSCVCPLILVMCIYVGLLLLGAGCWAAYGLSGDLMARDAAISHHQSPTPGLDSHNRGWGGGAEVELELQLVPGFDGHQRRRQRRRRRAKVLPTATAAVGGARRRRP